MFLNLTCVESLLIKANIFTKCIIAHLLTQKIRQSKLHFCYMRPPDVKKVELTGKIPVRYLEFTGNYSPVIYYVTGLVIPFEEM